MPPTHIEEFNTITGLIFAQLYENFPFAEPIDEPAIGRGMGLEGDSGVLPSGRDFRRLLYETLRWLHGEGFIHTHRGGEVSSLARLVLSGHAFTVMNAVPEGLSDSRSFGERVGEAAKSAGSEAGRSAVSTIVGEILGGLLKGLIT